MNSMKPMMDHRVEVRQDVLNKQRIQEKERKNYIEFMQAKGGIVTVYAHIAEQCHN